MITNAEKARAVERYCRAKGIRNIDLLTRGSKYIFLRGKPLVEWHRLMWTWISNNPRQEPRDFFKEVFEYDLDIKWALDDEGEFACMYATILREYAEDYEFRESETRCTGCPLKPSNSTEKDCRLLWRSWFDAKMEQDETKARQIANQIAGLEWDWDR